MTPGYRKALAVLWVLLLIGVSLAAWRSAPQLDSSILALLPQVDRQPMQQRAVDQLGAEFSSRLVLLVQADSDALSRQLTQNLAQRLENTSAVAGLQWRITRERLQTLLDFYRPWRFQVLSPELRRQLQAGEFTQWGDTALRRLLRPVSGIQIDLVGDPFNLLPTLLESFGGDRVQAERGLMRVSAAKKPTYLILATLAGDPFGLSLQQSLLPRLQQMQVEVAQQGGQLLMSGMLLHAAAGAEQARSEISTIGVISLLGIVLLVLFAFRRWQAPLLVLLPVVAGCLFAAAVTALIFGRLHLVTLAFGAGLAGVSVDYALHYLAAHEEPSERSVLQRILPGLIIGGLSSVLGYGAQVLAPFPGLRQMACFAVAGLTGAWLSVVLWYPLLLAVLPPAGGARSARWLAACFGRLPVLSPRSSMRLLAVLLLLAVVLITTGHARDDLHLLQMSPPALLTQDRQIRDLLGPSSSTRFLLVTAPDAETLLQREEQLGVALNRLQQEHAGFRFSSLHDWVPSLRTQAENVALVTALYANEATRYFHRLSCDRLTAPAETALARDSGRRLTLQAWLNSPARALAPGLWLQTGTSQVAGIVRLSGADAISAADLSAAAATVTSVQYVDRISDISSLLSRYRVEISFWVVGAYLVVVVLLVWRYGRSSWRLAGPPLVATLLVAGTLSHLDSGLNLFHLLALLLVLGLGLDMGIFLQEGAGESHVWLAVTLSMLTSLLAFGLLVLSATPLLHDFGLTVLLGLGGIWLVSFLVRKTA